MNLARQSEREVRRAQAVRLTNTIMEVVIMDMKQILLPALLQEHEVYTSLFLTYKAAMDDEAPGKKAWLASLDPSGFDVADNFSDGRTRAAGSEDPSEVLAILNRLDAVRKEVKDWLDGMFAAQNHRAANMTEGVPTPEELRVQLDKVRENFDACMTMANLGHMTREDVEEALTFETEVETDGSETDIVVKTYWQDRPVRGDKTAFSYKPEGTVKVPSGTSRVEGPRKNSKRIRLIVDGTLAPAGQQLTESCQKNGITTEQLQNEVVKSGGKDAWTKEAKYNDSMVEINGTTFGLYMDKS